MDLAKAIEIVKSLADGLDPTSHKPLISESVYQNPDTTNSIAPLPSIKWLKCILGPAAPSSRGW
jgi:hypothetical protein